MRLELQIMGLSTKGKKYDLISRLQSMKKLLEDHEIKDCKVVLSRSDIQKYTPSSENQSQVKTNKTRQDLESNGPTTRFKRGVPSTSTSTEKKGQVIAAKILQDLESNGPTTGLKNTMKRRRIEAPPPSRPNQNNANRRRKSTLKTSTLSLKPSLYKYELVWAHVKGYPIWPGIIEDELPNGKYRIHFFGDYSRSDVNKTKIMHLMEGFDHYTAMVEPSTLLLKAMHECKLFVFEQNRKTCPICEVFKMKMSTI